MYDKVHTLIITFKTQVYFSKFLQFVNRIKLGEDGWLVSLPESEIKLETIASTAGWGGTSLPEFYDNTKIMKTPPTYPNHLHRLNVRVIKTSMCDKDLVDEKRSKYLCAVADSGCGTISVVNISINFNKIIVFIQFFTFFTFLFFKIKFGTAQVRPRLGKLCYGIKYRIRHGLGLAARFFKSPGQAQPWLGVSLRALS